MERSKGAASPDYSTNNRMTGTKEKISSLIKQKALDLGFSACGIARAEPLTRESVVFRQWLNNGRHAGMKYLSRNVEKRFDPTLLNEWARSVIMLAFNYFPGHDIGPASSLRISKYAYGKDYHEVIRAKLKHLVRDVEEETGGITARVFVDSAPVTEKAWAVRCGLGWIGKNGLLINRQAGSFFFLGTIITSLDLAYDKPEPDEFCGSCTRCMEACPNKAIVAPGILQADRCIAYLTIEHKGPFLEDTDTGLHSWIFGCDICQDVCPWNDHAKPHAEPDFMPRGKLLAMTDKDWQNLNEEDFSELFKGSAVERTGYDSLRRNIEKGIREMEKD